MESKKKRKIRSEIRWLLLKLAGKLNSRALEAKPGLFQSILRLLNDPILKAIKFMQDRYPEDYYE